MGSWRSINAVVIGLIAVGMGHLECAAGATPSEGLPASGPGPNCQPCCPAAPAISGFQGRSLLAVDKGDTGDSFVLHLFDVSEFARAPIGGWQPPRFEHPSWTQSNLGTLFGVAADEAGDIYLSRTTLMTVTSSGALGGGLGAIVRIDGGTGAATVLASLPQSAPQLGPGLGNLTWSCAHASLFVTNFEDGRLYRVDPHASPAMRIRSAWDFASDTLTIGGAPEVGDAPGAAPLGERVWAVAVNGDRLFFSVWSQDGSATTGAPNTIWSVALSPQGDPIPGTKALEIVLDGPDVRPMPVADLQFDGECCLFVAQRTMFGLSSSAHASDLLRYCWSTTPEGNSAWIPTGSFQMGIIGSGDQGHSAAGGVAVDPSLRGWVWATGDLLLQEPLSYGVQGMPISGGDSNNSLVIDVDGDASEIIIGDKAGQGSCEFVCSAAPRDCSAEVESVECVLGPDGLPTGTYSVTVTLFNNSGATATLLLIPSLGEFQYLNPPLPSGQSLTTKLVVSGSPGEVIAIPFGLYNGLTACCGTEATIELPECRCMLFTDVEVVCVLDGDPGTNTYTVTFTVRNIATMPSFVASWLFLIPPQGAPYVFTPTVKNVFPLPPGGQTSVTVTLSFTVPPTPDANGVWSLVVPMSLHNANLAICCDALLHLEGTLPCDLKCSSDLNNDGVVNGVDLAILLGLWGRGGETCADLNGDGIVDAADLAILLGHWS